MGAPGRLETVSGTTPQGFAVPRGEGRYLLLFDACVAYTSFGVLDERIKAGKPIPSHWGLDENGNPTTDPAAVKKGCRQPIGGHKGFGLSILGELLTGILSDGPVIDAPANRQCAV
jgi:LDH2 family malate/lactate/ureidoglycolate dehydrogenase